MKLAVAAIVLMVAVAGTFVYLKEFRTPPPDRCAEVNFYVDELDVELLKQIDEVPLDEAPIGRAAGLNRRVVDQVNRAKQLDDQERATAARNLETGTKYATAVVDNPNCFTVEERVNARVWLDAVR